MIQQPQEEAVYVLLSIEIDSTGRSVLFRADTILTVSSLALNRNNLQFSVVTESC